MTVVKTWKQPKHTLMNEWIKTMWYTHTHTHEYYSAIKKMEILPLVTTWMNLECIMLSEISQPRKTNIVMFSLMCGI